MSLSSLQYFLLDMDGTLYLGPKAIPGAAEFVCYLRQSGRRHLFFTNNPTRNASEYAAKLQRLGIEATAADILTSGEATITYLLRRTPFRRVFVVGTPSFEDEVTRAGLQLAQEEAEAVVLAFDTTLTYAKLQTACALLDRGVPYFATNPDKVCPTDRGNLPDCGATAALLEAATGRVPQYLGKPSAEMIYMALEKLGLGNEAHTGVLPLPSASIAMVGDRLYTDMEMAYGAGITAVCVLSGESSAQDIKQAARRPDYVFPSVRELHRALLSAAGS